MIRTFDELNAIKFEAPEAPDYIDPREANEWVAIPVYPLGGSLKYVRSVIESRGCKTQGKKFTRKPGTKMFLSDDKWPKTIMEYEIVSLLEAGKILPNERVKVSASSNKGGKRIALVFECNGKEITWSKSKSSDFPKGSTVKVINGAASDKCKEWLNARGVTIL